MWRELLSVERALLQVGDKVNSRSVLLCTDATAVVKYVNWGNGPSRVLSTIMRRIFDYCVPREIMLSAEHVPGTEMKEAAVDSLSRWDGFEVRKQVFDVFHTSPEWGRADGNSGYTLDLYATEKSTKLARFAARDMDPEDLGGPLGCVGDARTVELQPHENVWVCPPLQFIQNAVDSFMQQRVMGTVVVPDWANQSWHVFLRRRALRSQELPRSKLKPTIFDTASGPQHAHYADKWSFRAFFVDNRDGRADNTVVVPGEAPRISRDAPRSALPQRQLGRQGEVFQGVQLAQVHQAIVLKVLDLCSGQGSVPWALEQLGVAAKVWECETDPKARALASARCFAAGHLSPHSVWYWASEAGLHRLRELKPRFVVAGFPCQSVSRANAHGKGLQGKSRVFEAVATIITFLRSENEQVDFLVECTDFGRNHPDFCAHVGRTLGVQPVILEAADIGACKRRRAYWASFPIPKLAAVEFDPNTVLDEGRTALWPK